MEHRSSLQIPAHSLEALRVCHAGKASKVVVRAATWPINAHIFFPARLLKVVNSDTGN